MKNRPAGLPGHTCSGEAHASNQQAPGKRAHCWASSSLLVGSGSSSSAKSESDIGEAHCAREAGVDIYLRVCAILKKFRNERENTSKNNAQFAHSQDYVERVLRPQTADNI